MRNRMLVLAALVLAGTHLFAQQDVFGRMRAEAYDRSQVMKFFDHLVINIGPRLAGSPEYKAAANWTRLPTWVRATLAPELVPMVVIRSIRSSASLARGGTRLMTRSAGTFSSRARSRVGWVAHMSIGLG